MPPEWRKAFAEIPTTGPRAWGDMAPVRYGRHTRAEPGSTCELCRAAPSRPVVDHCHAHGWVRGVLCPRCNWAMAFVDRRITPSAAMLAGPTALADMTAYVQRCHECVPIGVHDIVPAKSLRLSGAMTERRKLIAAGCIQLADDGSHVKWGCDCGQHTATIPRLRCLSPEVVHGMVRDLACLPKGWLQ